MIISKVRVESLLGDTWCAKVHHYIETGIPPPNFVGHCCEWQQQKKMASQASSNAALPRRFDGHLVLPEYGLLLDSPLHGDVDMHAFGNGDGELKGLWHSVVGEATAIKAEQCKLEPDGQDCSPGAVTIREVTIPGLGVGDQKKVSYSLFLCLFVYFSS